MIGIPPVYSPRNLAAPIATSIMASLTSISSPHTGPRYRYSSGGGPNGSSRAAGGSGSWRLRRIFPPFNGLELIVDDPIFGVPYLPDLHLRMAVRTAQRVAPRALLIPLTVGQGGDNPDRPFDKALHFRQGGLNHALQLGKRLGRLHAVIADPLEAFRKDMLHHAPNKRVDCYRFPLHPLTFMRTIVIRDPLAIIAVDPPERDRRTHHIFGQIPRQTLIPCRDIPFLYVGDKPLAIACVTRIDQPPALRRLDRLAQHSQQMPLPLLPQQGIRHIVKVDPLLRLWIPAATRGNDMQMRIVVPIPSVGLDHDDIAALQGPATDPAKDIIQASHPTTHERTQHHFGLPIKRLSEHLRHRQDKMAVDDAFMEHLAHLTDPVVHIDFRAAQAQR